MPGGELAGLPELEVGGLAEADARALLDAALTGPVDARVRDQIVAETRGNPLALLELPRGLTPAELAGGFGLPGALPLTGRIEDSFRRQIDGPAGARRGGCCWWRRPTRPATRRWYGGPPGGSGIGARRRRAGGGGGPGGVRRPGAVPASAGALGGLPVGVGPRTGRRRTGSLAEATDPQADPDRRAWHRAQAAAGPDEEVAAELERSAGRAQARGGLAAAAAFLERAALLTADPARRAERTLAAAQADLRAGAFDRALELLATAEAGPLDDVQGARADLLRGQIAFASGPGSDAPLLLLKAARRLEPLDPDLARETYLDAWLAALFAGHLAVGGDLAGGLPRGPRHARAAAARRGLPTCCLTVSRCWSPTGRPPPPRRCGRPAAPLPARTSRERAAEKVFRWGRTGQGCLRALWDVEGWRLTTRHVQLARDAGALDQLPFLLVVLAVAAVARGDFAAAASLIAETEAVCEATGSHIAPYAALVLAASVGRQAEAAPLIRGRPRARPRPQGEGAAVTWAHWVAAILYNGLGRYADALAAARQASGHRLVHISMWALPELVEAAARTGNTGLAGECPRPVV